MPRKALLAGLFCTMILSLGQPSEAAAKKYQVTGKVISLTEKVITVEKADGEKWELDRSEKMEVDGKLEVGAKVTIHYHMVADDAAVK